VPFYLFLGKIFPCSTLEEDLLCPTVHSPLIHLREPGHLAVYRPNKGAAPLFNVSTHALRSILVKRSDPALYRLYFLRDSMAGPAPLLLDFGMENLYEPETLIAGNLTTLKQHLVNELPRIEIVISGEMQRAVEIGLIPRNVMEDWERAAALVPVEACNLRKRIRDFV
jgi:hypothetical protein